MSIFNRLKAEIRYKNSTNHQHQSNPIYGGKGQHDVVILSEKPKKKRKLMEVQSESKVTLKSTVPKGKHGGGNNQSSDPSTSNSFQMDDEEMIDDEDMGTNGKPKEPTKVAWGPSEILEHLNEPQIVNNINYVITTLNKTEQEEGIVDRKGKPVTKSIETVWDHSQSPIGKKSDNNFFVWFETMAAGEARKVMQKENLIYE